MNGPAGAIFICSNRIQMILILMNERKKNPANLAPESNFKFGFVPDLDTFEMAGACRHCVHIVFKLDTTPDNGVLSTIDRRTDGPWTDVLTISISR